MSTESESTFSEHPTRSKKVVLAALMVGVALSRIPWLDAGYGADPDSGRVVLMARHILETGRYAMSRSPGYPLHEYAAAALLWLGPVGVNALSALASVIAVYFFAKILQHYRVPGYVLVAGAFALVPVFFTTSTQTIDYVPALAGILASTYCVLRGRPWAAAILLGLAVGFRLTSGAMLLPLALWLFVSSPADRRVGMTLQFALLTLVMSALVFLPVFLTTGLRNFTFAEPPEYPPLAKLLELGLTGVWGHSPTAVVAVVGLLVVLGLVGARRALRDRNLAWAVGLSALTVVLYLVAFLRLPLEPGYLVSIVPFVLLFWFLLLPRRLVVPLAALLLLGFVWTTEGKDLKLLGSIRRDREIRLASLSRTRSILARVDGMDPKPIVVVAWELPQLEVYMTPEQRDSHHYVYFIETEEQLKGFLQQNYQVTYLHGLDYYNHQYFGFWLQEYGAKPLFEEGS